MENILETANNNAHLYGVLEIMSGEYVNCQSLIDQYHRLKKRLKECEKRGNGQNQVN